MDESEAQQLLGKLFHDRPEPPASPKSMFAELIYDYRLGGGAFDAPSPALLENRENPVADGTVGGGEGLKKGDDAEATNEQLIA